VYIVFFTFIFAGAHCEGACKSVFPSVGCLWETILMKGTIKKRKKK